MAVTASNKPSESEPEVRTAAGVVRGGREAGLAVFRGISFAEPPVGALRFAAPQPVRGWDGVRPAVAYGPPPPQSSVLGASQDAAGDDWLTLNVWTPEPDPEAGLPVLVWIPGGGYAMGDAGLPEYDGGHLARSGVVVVTLNYRLGIEGFAQIDGAPANRGLLDQVAALQWVRDNIRVFGGDPDHVTVFGQSAGGGSVAALLAMPRAAGLFRRAVAQSVPGTFFSAELAAEIAAAFAAELGVRPTVSGLSAVAPAELPAAGDAVFAKAAQWRERWGQITHRSILFAPVVDGDVLPATPWQALADGAARDVGLLVGHTRDEHRLFSLIDGVLGQVTREQTETALRLLAPGPDGARRYREAFPAAADEELYELVNGDWLFRMPSLHLADAQVAGGGQAYLYELTWPAPGVGGGLGACHGLDVPLVFGNLRSGRPAMLIGDPPSPVAEELSARIRGAWTAFAAHGDPGWPPYDADRRLTQIFDARSSVTAYPEETSRLLWQDHTFPELPLLARSR
ncbi:carboxylic ester hydrolase [Sphaerisporangium melleum]|uniref:Carboxylic ester hydrolase n=1 Tax=Sphaerisporangium melleum TaxID=321316 RepID=A0A917VFA0_9ACTN|nr:carboxylesterase family protein [Sphaerisporangium melleum]GGK74045.1 carboxylic ester hydrolase [Sphaerisporangium melleum]GII70867.1 carboxylic ester hydrolase [Sphaerisporangium melleum]